MAQIPHFLPGPTGILAPRTEPVRPHELGNAPVDAQDDRRLGDLIVTPDEEGAPPDFSAASVPAVTRRKKSSFGHSSLQQIDHTFRYDIFRLLSRGFA